MFRYEHEDDADDEIPPPESEDYHHAPQQQDPPPQHSSNNHTSPSLRNPPIRRRKPSTEDLGSSTNPLCANNMSTVLHRRSSRTTDHSAFPPLHLSQNRGRAVDQPLSAENDEAQENRMTGERKPWGEDVRSETLEEKLQRLKKLMKERKEKGSGSICASATGATDQSQDLAYDRGNVGRHRSRLLQGTADVDAASTKQPCSTSLLRQGIERSQEDLERLENLLAPVRVSLVLLRNTKIPPYNLRLRTRAPAEILKERLLPIGKYLLAILKKEREERRGEVEVDICQYIAETYWPHRVLEVDGMRIMEMYRNTVFLEGSEMDWLNAWSDGSWSGGQVEQGESQDGKRWMG